MILVLFLVELFKGFISSQNCIFKISDLKSNKLGIYHFFKYQPESNRDIIIDKKRWRIDYINSI